ncbi:hypothetical protein CEXT_582651 [Caerostris extrusa]|uniref:Endonuclease/exonuclease/phosphatase domain-containing protein n=1 Tax=Caerostris extrusa TaxID=172846 RepID=A0AAV4YFA5_CAEEX|nr:hypothetical protein CEXT_582651 [Caerostris extrusa]
MSSRRHFRQISEVNVYLLPKYRKVASGILVGSKTNLSSISIDNKTIVIGDMNAHSTRWGYGDMNAARKEIEDLLNSSLLDLIYDANLYTLQWKW